jgi:hypothetical protein
MSKICEICKGEQHTPEDHPFLPQMETSPLEIPGITESHNPLDIPFGHEVSEINKNIKDVDEGGMGSGRQPDYGEPVSKEPTGGELIAFETVSIPNSASAVSIKKPIDGVTEITKQLWDKKLSCPCWNKKN